MVRAPVDPIDHQRQVLAQLVGQMLVDDAADDRRARRAVVNLEVIGSRSPPSAGAPSAWCG
jgi:hypothetical protein